MCIRVSGKSRFFEFHPEHLISTVYIYSKTTFCSNLPQKGYDIMIFCKHKFTLETSLEVVRFFLLLANCLAMIFSLQDKVMVTCHVMKIPWHVMTYNEMCHFGKIGPFSTCEVSKNYLLKLRRSMVLFNIRLW